MKRVKLKIHGKIQGVFFRYTAKQIADKLKVKGWIKNNFDGTIDAVIEGKDEAVDEMVKWCKAGPTNSIVEKVDIREEYYKGEFKEFKIEI